MLVRSYFGIFGSFMVIAGALSPMLRIPVMGNWNYWDIEPVLATLVMVLAALGLLSSVFARPSVLRFCGWSILVLVLFTLCAVYFKVNSYFDFIPFRKLAAAAAGIVRYRWIGWIVLVAGAAMMIAGGRARRDLKKV